MSNGIAHNNLNDISKIYLDTISDINKKEQSDDVKRWQQEETGCETKPSPFKKKKYKEDWQPEIEHSKLGDAKKKADKKRESKLPPHLRGDAIGKMKKAFASTNDVSDPKYQREAFSNWRSTLREVTSDAEAVEIDDQPEVTEKKVKNKIKINPEFKEAVKQMGGELLEVTEVDDKEEMDPKSEKVAKMEKKLKLRLLRTKMMAVKQGADDSINAGYEPKGQIVETIKKVTKEGVTAKYKGKNYKLLPGKVRAKMSGKGGLDGDYRDEVGKAKDWVTDKIGLTNTKRDGVKEGVTATHKGTEYKLLPGKVRKDLKKHGKGGLDGDYRTEAGKVKDYVTDKLGLTNTKKDGVKCKGHQDCSESKEMKEDKALAAVKAAIIKKHGKGAIYDPKKKQSPEDKAKVAAERKKRQDADNKAFAGRAKKAGYKNPQDYANVVARYGSEDNYKKGKGLGT